MATRKLVLDVAGREVTVSNPDKVYFPRTGHTKLDLVRYYLAVAEGALRGVAGRPMALKRFVNGAEGEFFFQKRAPEKRPDWVETVELKFPSGRSAHEIVVRDAAQLAWVVNLGCIDLNPHPVRAADLDHPDELRVDLDPMPGVPWSDILQVALVTRDTLQDFGLVGWPKTSGSRGFHVYCRIERRWTFSEVRRAAVALAREVERRAPEIASSKWWKEERQGPDRRLRLLGPPDPRRPGVDAAALGPGARLPARGVHHRHRARHRRRGRRPRRGDRRPGRLADGPARAGRPARGGRVRRRPLAAPLRQGRGRAVPGPALQAPPAGPAGPRGLRARAGPGQDGRADRAAPHHHAADRGGQGGHRGRGPRGPGALEGPPPRCLAPARPDRSAGRRHAGPEHGLVPDPAEPPQRARGRPATPGGAGGRLRPLEWPAARLGVSAA